jgi:enoyl-CoA hydratase/carnithine racemase
MSAMNKYLVKTNCKNGISTIVFNRSEKLNDLNSALLKSVHDALVSSNKDDSIRVIILTGEGRAFCAGADLNDVQGKDTAQIKKMEQQIDYLQDISRQIIYSDKIVIAAVNGWAIGGGFEWVINCDFSIWSNKAKAWFPETKWGLFVGGGVTMILPTMVGLVKAKELLIFGKEHSAEELENIGIAWKVVEEDQVIPEALDAAQEIVSLSSFAVSELKKVMRKCTVPELELALNLEKDAMIKTIKDLEVGHRIGGFDGAA